MTRIILLFIAFLVSGGYGQLYASEITIPRDTRTQQKSVSNKLFKIADDHVLIYRSADVIQCELPGISLEESADILTGSNIEVFSSYCGVKTGLSVIEMCGAGTTDIFLHEIKTADLFDAEQAGFLSVAELAAAGLGYEVTACP